jgi:hypothetical protein
MIKNNHFNKNKKIMTTRQLESQEAGGERPTNAMDFKEQKAQIIGMLRTGDKKAIAKEAGTSSVTLWSAFKKCCVSEMTETERKAWITAVNFMSRRQREYERIEEKTAKLSAKL